MEKTLASRAIYAGRVVHLEVVDVALPDGRTSQREIIRHPGAVVVLAERADGQFIFVRQYRKPIEMELLEAVAGTLDPEEEPEACAARELREETGYEATSLTPLGRMVPAPGYSSEWHHLFYATTDNTPGATAPDEDEHITVALFARTDLDEMITAGTLLDAKTLAAWLKYTQWRA